MIERHVNFEVFMDRIRDFEKLFADEYRPAMASMPGFMKVELLREQDCPGMYQMVIRFENAEAAAAWRASQEHRALSPRLKEMVSGSQLTVYEVVA